MTETVKNATPHNNKGDIFTSFDVADFDVPRGKDEVWRFIPLRNLRGIHKGDFATAVDPDIEVAVPAGSEEAVEVADIEKTDPRAEKAGAPSDRVAAQAWTSMSSATLVSVKKDQRIPEPVTITVTGKGDGVTSFGAIVVELEQHAEATVAINYRGSGTHADNVQFVVGDGARLTVIVDADWDDDAVHLSGQNALMGRDAVLHHNVAIFGGEIVRVVPRVKFTAPGGDVELLGVYFADDGQYFENRLLVDHSVPNCRSNVLYKGALQGDPTSKRPDTRCTWVGDVLIRAEALNTDTYETNRNLVLSEGARADAVPNLEIETGEIVGAGHAATVGRFDDEQLFYLMSRGISEADARRLIIHGFFSDVINYIPVPEIREELEARVTDELQRVAAQPAKA